MEEFWVWLVGVPWRVDDDNPKADGKVMMDVP